MKRRWIIRSFFIGLLALCTGAWIFGYRFHESVGYLGNGYFLSIGIATGKLDFLWVDNIPTFCEGLFCGTVAYKETGDQFKASTPGGFTVGPLWCRTHWAIPFWLPTTSLGVLLWFVWRKTRPQPDPRTAFPVEVKEAD